MEHASGLLAYTRNFRTSGPLGLWDANTACRHVAIWGLPHQSQQPTSPAISCWLQPVHQRQSFEQCEFFHIFPKSQGIFRFVILQANLCLEMVYGSLVPPKFSHLYLRITCASKDHLRLRPPHLRLRAPHLRLHFFLTYASLLLIENVCTLSFHNAMILNLACYLNFIPPCPPQWLYLNPNSFFTLPPPCLPQCYQLKSNSLFKLPPLAFHNAMN